MRISVSRKHYSRGPIEEATRLPDNCRTFYLDTCGYSNSHATGCSVATHKGKIIGLFRYRLRGRKTLRTLGTWVDPKFRGQGIGFKLVSAAMKKENRTIIKGYSISNGGAHLLAKLSKIYKVTDPSANSLI